MSYIRSGNNPEGLYIWGDGETVYVVKGTDTIGTIPSKIFNGLIKEYINNGHEDCEHEGAEIKEVWVNSNDIELDETKEKGSGSNQCKTRLSYDNWSLIMWGVTWDWIATFNSYR